jgi:hypothetical protein
MSRLFCHWFRIKIMHCGRNSGFSREDFEVTISVGA